MAFIDVINKWLQITAQIKQKTNKMETQNKQRSLEEALADLRRPEVRASLETYVPASFAAFRDVGGEDYELLADAAHFLVDLKYKEKYSEKDMAFLHEIVDMKKAFNPENDKENQEIIYQRGKRFVLESGFNAEDYALFVVNLYLAKKTSTESGRQWVQNRAPTGNLYDYCLLAIKSEDYLPMDRLSVEDKQALREKIPVVPFIGSPFTEYLDEMREYKMRNGLGVDELPVDVSILRNAVCRFGQFMGMGINFYNRFRAEATQEIPGLKDKIVEIGRKYGVEMNVSGGK